MGNLFSRCVLMDWGQIVQPKCWGVYSIGGGLSYDTFEQVSAFTERCFKTNKNISRIQFMLDRRALTEELQDSREGIK